MASNIKWYKRALRALDSGRLDVWERLKNKLPEDRRSYLESQYKLNTKTGPDPVLVPEVSEPTSTVEVLADPQVKTTKTPAEKTVRTTTKKATTKKATTRKRTTSTRKKTTSKEK
jgi:hypothetical protein